MTVQTERGVEVYTTPVRDRLGKEGFYYDRVVGFIDPANEEVTPLARTSDYHDGEAKLTRLQMGRVLDDRLLNVLRELSQNATYNCHRFARIMQGMEVATHQEEEDHRRSRALGIRLPKYDEDYEPIADDLTSCQVTSPTDLKLGQVGYYGPPNALARDRFNPILHSLIGLGEGSPHSLQVLSSYSELGIVDTQTQLAAYQRSKPDGNYDLFTQP